MAGDTHADFPCVFDTFADLHDLAGDVQTEDVWIRPVLIAALGELVIDRIEAHRVHLDQHMTGRGSWVGMSASSIASSPRACSLGIT